MLIFWRVRVWERGNTDVWSGFVYDLDDRCFVVDVGVACCTHGGGDWYGFRRWMLRCNVMRCEALLETRTMRGKIQGVILILSDFPSSWECKTCYIYICICVCMRLEIDVRWTMNDQLVVLIINIWLALVPYISFYKHGNIESSEARAGTYRIFLSTHYIESKSA